MRFLYAVRDFLMPPRCAGCHELFRVKYGEKNGLCPECAKKWELAKAVICPECGKMWSACRCMPKNLERAGATQLIKLVPYRSKSSVSNNVVLYLKRNYDFRTFDFVAEQLAGELERFLSKSGLHREDAVLTYCPRRRSAKNSQGFDQAEVMATEISKRVGIVCKPLLKRRGLFEGRAQKKLDSSKRAKNVKDAFMLSGKAEIRGKTVFLLDDLVTTGATMAECVRLIKKGRPGLVVGIALATTEKTEA